MYSHLLNLPNTFAIAKRNIYTTLKCCTWNFNYSLLYISVLECTSTDDCTPGNVCSDSGLTSGFCGKYTMLRVPYF